MLSRSQVSLPPCLQVGTNAIPRAAAQGLIQEIVSTYATTAATMSTTPVSSNALTQAVDAAQKLMASRRALVPTQELAAIALLLLPGSAHVHMKGLLSLLSIDGTVRSTCGDSVCVQHSFYDRPCWRRAEPHTVPFLVFSSQCPIPCALAHIQC